MSDRPKHKSFRTLLKFQICSCAQPQTIADVLRKDNTTCFVNFHCHGIHYGICHLKWQNQYRAVIVLVGSSLRHEDRAQIGGQAASARCVAVSPAAIRVATETQPGM